MATKRNKYSKPIKSGRGKKTRQGMGKGTKKSGVVRYRGQGGKKRRSQ